MQVQREACNILKSSVLQVETGSAITWKYPSCILKGDNSVGEFYSVALTNNQQQADTGAAPDPSFLYPFAQLHLARRHRSASWQLRVLRHLP